MQILFRFLKVLTLYIPQPPLYPDTSDTQGSECIGPARVQSRLQHLHRCLISRLLLQLTAHLQVASPILVPESSSLAYVVCAYGVWSLVLVIRRKILGV